MNLLQEQVNELQQQMEVLKLAVERLPSQIASELAEQSSHIHSASVRVESTSAGYDSNDEAMQGLILDEEMSGDRTTRSAVSQDMPPEAQVQRLTAQLTAAYNRIAALEEQLLSQRLVQ